MTDVEAMQRLVDLAREYRARSMFCARAAAAADRRGNRKMGETWRELELEDHCTADALERVIAGVEHLLELRAASR